MKQAILITGGSIDTDYMSSVYKRFEDDCFVLGVDGGCKSALSANVSLDAIIGDFDTLDESIKKEITDSGVKTITLNPVKDVTDTHAALDYLFIHEYTKVIVFGARGTRLDHTLGNLMVAFSYFPKMIVEFIDEHNCIRQFQGPAVIKGKKQDRYKYLSIIPIEESFVKSTSGLKYPVTNRKFNVFDSFGISNEIVGTKDDDCYSIEFEFGKFFVIESSD